MEHKILQRLIEMGFTVSKRKVLELLREFFPWKRLSHKKANCSINWPNSQKNILDRDFSPPRPNMAWLSDITTIKTDSGNFYLCVVLDLFARRIVADRLSVSQDVSLIRYTFQDAFYKRGKLDGLIFHSDQGGQYRSYEFQSLLLRHKVRQSFSKPGVPYDNAPMESFFANLKVEEIYRFRYTGIRNLSASLRDYISFYNNIRDASGPGEILISFVNRNDLFGINHHINSPRHYHKCSYFSTYLFCSVCCCKEAWAMNEQL